MHEILKRTWREGLTNLPVFCHTAVFLNIQCFQHFYQTEAVIRVESSKILFVSSNFFLFHLQFCFDLTKISKN